MLHGLMYPGGYWGFQATGMIEGFWGFEIFDSWNFWGKKIWQVFFGVAWFKKGFLVDIQNKLSVEETRYLSRVGVLAMASFQCSNEYGRIIHLSCELRWTKSARQNMPVSK